MINKIFSISQISKIIIIFLFSWNNLFANDILIDAEVVDIKEKGNLIVASGSVRITDENNIEINGQEARYDKLNETITISGNVIFLDKDNNYRAKSDKIIFDRKKDIISSLGNSEIELLDKNNVNINLKIKGKNSYFNRSKETIEIKENVIVEDYLNELEIYSKDINFNRKNSLFSSKENTLINDNFDNEFKLSSFNFNLENKILKAEEIALSDNQDNSILLKNGYLDLNSNELIGSDFTLNLNNNFFGNPENDPRLIGRYIVTNKSVTTMKKSVFTTCKNVEGKCPTWSISADEVKHKKNEKRIEYKKAWLEIYDVPVAYFPYFFHPDPSVDRQSGFLFPQFTNSSNLGFSTQIPYYKVIDNNKDMTISPRIYTNNNLFVQSEYRQVFENSNLITDISYNKKNNSNSHFFSTLKGSIENTFYEMKLEAVSNKDYLKKYQIKSPLISNYSVLNSSILFEKYADDYIFSTSIDVVEDLTKIDSDKYEYTIPRYDFSKETTLNDKIFNNLTFNSSGSYRKYNTNIDEADVINDLILESQNQNQITNLDTDISILFRNINTYGDLSETYKDNTDYKILNTTLVNFRYPLIKQSDNGKKFLTPLASIRYSPSKGANLKNEDAFVTFQNLFLLDRINNKTVEEGMSTTIGLEYKNLNNLNSEKLKLGLAVNLRDKYDNDLPLSSSLGQKTSDLIGYSGINITQNLSFDYNFSIDQNLSETNYTLMTANYSGDKFKTSLQYMEKSNFIGDESYLKNTTQLEINKTNSLAFETNKNLDKNLTDYYNLIYKYKNDCLEASIVYNKQFYKEDSINPGQNIFFKISFIPFGSVISPNINE